METSLKLGLLLQRARRSRGLTQTEVARALGLKTGQSISDLERGRSQSFPPERLVELARLYRINAAEVVDLFIAREKERLEKKLRKKIRL